MVHVRAACVSFQVRQEKTALPRVCSAKLVEEALPVVGRWKFRMNELKKWRKAQVTVEDEGNLTAGWSKSSQGHLEIIRVTFTAT